MGPPPLHHPTQPPHHPTHPPATPPPHPSPPIAPALELVSALRLRFPALRISARIAACSCCLAALRSRYAISASDSMLQAQERLSSLLASRASAAGTLDQPSMPTTSFKGPIFRAVNHTSLWCHPVGVLQSLLIWLYCMHYSHSTKIFA